MKKNPNGKQCTIGWYVEDNKLSHTDGNVVDEVLDMIRKTFGDIEVTRGKSHVFLGMKICIRNDTIF